MCHMVTTELSGLIPDQSVVQGGQLDSRGYRDENMGSFHMCILMLILIAFSNSI